MRLFVFIVLVVVLAAYEANGSGLGIRLVIGNPKKAIEPSKSKQTLHQIPGPTLHPNGDGVNPFNNFQSDSALNFAHAHRDQLDQAIPIEQLEQLTDSTEFREKAYSFSENYEVPLPPPTPMKLLKMTNMTNSLVEKLELPFAQRSTLGITFPVSGENDIHKARRPASVGVIVSDTFIVKEHKVGPSFPSPVQRKNSVLNGILQNMMQDEKPDIVYPAELIKQEIPLNGNFHHYGISNITSYLLDLSYKSSESKYFICLQFQNLDRFAKDDLKINVVMGDKRLTYNDIQKLDSLYAYVTHGVYDDPVKNSVRAMDIDNIRDFVYYVKDLHRELLQMARAKANQVYRAQTKDYHDLKFGEDIFTWPYVNTVAYRTL